MAYSDLYNGTGSATNAISYQNATFTSDQSQIFAMFPSGMNHRIISLFREIGDGTEFEMDQIDVNGRLVISMSVGENATLTDKVQLFLLDENFNTIKWTQATGLDTPTSSTMKNITLTVDGTDVTWNPNKKYYLMLIAELDQPNDPSPMIYFSNFKMYYQNPIQLTQSYVDNNVFNYQPTYRYGFNGMERDDEMKGIGNSYDFGARMYDPRLGRWFSVDPRSNEYSSISSYTFALNMPICAKDPDGEVVVVVVDGDRRKAVKEALQLMTN